MGAASYFRTWLSYTVNGGSRFLQNVGKYDPSTLKMETSRYSKVSVLSVFYPEDGGNITLKPRYVWLINREDGGSRFLRNLGTCLLNCMAWYLRRREARNSSFVYMLCSDKWLFKSVYWEYSVSVSKLSVVDAFITYEGKFHSEEYCKSWFTAVSFSLYPQFIPLI